MSASGHETEIKLSMSDSAHARKLLRTAGFRVYRRRVFEANTVFDTLHCLLREAQQLLRVRQAGRTVTVTYKGTPEVSRHKSREELEVEASDAAAVTRIFDRLGFQPVFRYEKYRTEYRKGQRGGIAMVDETPIGTFIELEGEAEWIDRTARRFGFREEDYITASYGRLYLNWCTENGIEPGDMVFGRKLVQRKPS